MYVYVCTFQFQTQDADIGNWTVDNCILAQFAMEITLHPNKTNPNVTTVIEVPRHAQVDKIASNCGNTTQDLSLFWTDRELNSTNVLMRNLTLRFGRKNETGYGIKQAWGTFQLAYFDYNETKANETNTYKIVSSVKIDTHEVPKLMFEVPFHYSYLCGDVGTWQFYSELDYNFTTTTPNIMLNNATVSAKHFRFDAFREYDKPHPLVYRVSFRSGNPLFRVRQTYKAAKEMKISFMQILAMLCSVMPGQRLKPAMPYNVSGLSN